MARVPYVHVDTALAGTPAGEQVPLGDADRHHLRRVLRLGDGTEVELADGTGATARGRLTADGVALETVVAAGPAPTPRLTVAQALPKGRKLDEVVRQVTELGADRIVPVAADRSVARLDGAKAAKAVERWQAVARAACEQARRPTRPEVSSPTVPGALVVEGLAVLVAEPSADPPLFAVAAELATADEVVVAVGPEGGWSERELAELTAAGARTVRLGPHVLRTEHAAAAALAIVASAVGRWP